MKDVVDSLPHRNGAGCRVIEVRSGSRYSVALAESKGEIAEAQKLRFEVFNLELNQGLAESYLTGRDEDLFDHGCAHLMVRENATGLLVGTYRLQTGAMARAHHDYYSAGEFDLSPLDPYRAQIVEIGRACVHKNHRNSKVLATLWKGIAGFAALQGSRYVLGCSSVASQNPLEGLAIYENLKARNLATKEYRVQPWPDYVCRGSHPLPKAPPPSRPFKRLHLARRGDLRPSRPRSGVWDH